MIVSSGKERRSFRDIEIMDKRRLTIIDIITTSENRASGKNIICGVQKTNLLVFIRVIWIIDDDYTAKTIAILGR